MKVALIDPSLFTWPYDRELMQGLRAVGVDARVFGKVLVAGEAPGPQRGLVEHFYPSLARGPLAGLPHAIQRCVKGLSHGSSLSRLAQVFAGWRPDAIHFQWAPLPVVDRRFLPALRRIAPLVMTVHDSTPFNGNPGARIQQWGARQIFRDFDALIVHTEQARRRLGELGVSDDRIALIPHGLLCDGGAAMESLPPVEDLAGPDVTFLMFGKIKPYKGVDTLIEALARMPPELRGRTRVRVVGKPYMDIEPLRQMAQSLGVVERMAFDLRLVPDEELADVFAGAAAVVMPYREIDASGVLTMAIQSARIIVASNIGNFAELLANDRNALLVAPGDAAALSTAMSRVVADADLRGRLAGGVRALRTTIPSWTTIGEQTALLYRRLAPGEIRARA
jgi:glycosyltransferase involved in cell wall biosynthesis